MTTRTAIDRARLAMLLEAERDLFRERNPKSAAAHASTRHLLGGVPMTWMAKTAGPFPLYLERARGARVVDLDGHELTEGLLNHIEVAIRAYDPCLSCATHALGDMPLDVVLLGPDGQLLDRVVRSSDGALVHELTMPHQLPA